MERGHQVAQMGSIYKKASNVIVWLGSVDEDVGLLISALRSLHLKVSPQPFKQWQLRDDRWRDAWEELHGGDISGGSFHLQLSNGLYMLTRKPWFTRVWIIQEVANAKSAQIQCSAGSIEAMFLALAPWLLGQSIDEQPQAVFDIFPGLPRKWSWWAEERTLWALLSRFRECQATDPRDRVYALLGIASDMANDAIEPDYSKSEHQVLRDTCNYLFERAFYVGRAFLEQKMMRRAKPEDLEHFLERQGRVKWTEKIVQLASFDLGHSTLTLLLTKFETPLPVTLKLLREALKIGPDALDLLFDKCVFEDVDLMELVLAAAEIGEDALDVRFGKCKIPPRLTRVIFEAAILSGMEGAETLFRRRESEANIFQEVQETHQLRDVLCEQVLGILRRAVYMTGHGGIGSI
ncbi:HET domain-containing protein [Fusarium sp. LHS14.1]|nr:HET domain-containing protein [Fusarium sp. LHS14.1]